MNELLIAIATICSAPNLPLKVQLNCQTEMVKCALEKDKSYNQYSAERLAARVLECLEDRK